MRRFTEVQYFKSNSIMIVLNLVMLVALVTAIYNGTTATVVIILLVLALVQFTNLKTEITDEGISINLVPFFLKPKFIAWTDVSHVAVRKYAPIREYGGWGIRMGFNGMAYNIAGDKGLQIVLNNGKKILVGTQKMEELKQFLYDVAKDKL